MLNIITGRPGSGKTVTIYDKLLEFSSEDNIVITNPQTISSYETFLASNFITANLFSYDEIAEKVAEIIGVCPNDIATTTEKAIILSEVISNSTDLSLIGPEYAFSGVVNKISNAISDIYKAGSTSEKFKEWLSSAKYAGTVDKKFNDFSIIMERFIEKIHSSGLILPEELDEKVIKALSSYDGFICKNLFIDTLPEYTSSIVDMLCAVIEKAENTYAAFRVTDSKHSDYFAFFDSVEAIQKLKKYAESRIQVNEIKATRRTAKAKVESLKNGIDLISEHFFDRKISAKSEDEDSVRLFEASTPSGEVDIVSSEIQKLVKAGMKFDDIVVASPIIEDYISLLQQSFDNCGIPFHFFKNDVLANSRLFDYINTLLNCTLSEEYPLEDLVSLSHLNFIKLTSEEVEVVDMFEKRFGSEYSTAMANCKKFAPDVYETVSDVLDRISESVDFFADTIKDGTTAKDYSSAVIYALEIGNVKDSIFNDITHLSEGNEYQLCNEAIAAWNSFVDVLDSITSLHGENAMELSDFRSLLRKCCDDKKVINNNKYFGEVKVLSLPDVANGRSRALFVLGCNEGNLVSVPDETFFTQNEKVEICNGLSISIPDNKYYISKKIATVYAAFTTPYDRLSLSWSRLNSSYAPASRANILSSIVSLNNGQITTEEMYKKEEGDADFTQLLCRLSDICNNNEPISEEVKEKISAYSKNPLFSARLNKAILALERSVNSFEISNDNIPTFTELSITRAEKFNECPFKHFVSYALKPKVHKVFEENAANIGTFYHSVFRKFYEKVTMEGLSFKTLVKNKNDFDDILNPIIDDELLTHNENVLNSSAKFRFTAKAMRETLNVSVYNSIIQVVAGEFVPAMFEQDISKLSTMKFTLDNGETFRASGIIDRVDVVESGGEKFARVIDYKSGKVELNDEKLKLGIQLQLPMYMKALSDYKFGGMYYFHVHHPHASSDTLDSSVTKDFKLSGLTYKDSEIPEKTDAVLTTVGCSVSSDIVSIRKTTKGDFYSTSAIVSNDDIEKILGDATKNYLKAANGIANGYSVAEPVNTKTFSACVYCDFNPICGRAKTLPKF